MSGNRPSKAVIGAQIVGLLAVVVVAVWRTSSADWDLPLFAILLGFSVFSDLTAITTNSKVKISGSFLALVLAMVFLGGTPAAVIGVATILTGWLRWHDEWHYLLNNLLTYATFPLVTGIAFQEAVTRGSILDTEAAFYALTFAVFLLALAINFTMIASYSCYLDRSSFFAKVRTALIPLLPSELAAGGGGGGGGAPTSTCNWAWPGSRCSASSSSPSSTCSAPCSSPSNGPRSWSCAASSWPASRSGC
jgi:hypothetical protein